MHEQLVTHPLGQPGNEAYDASVRAKIKGTCTQKRKFGQQVRRAREFGDVDKIALLISSPTASARQIQEMIYEASKMDLKPGEFINLIRTAISKHQAIFGTKSTNLNLDVQTTLADVMMERLKNYKLNKINQQNQQNQQAVVGIISDERQEQNGL